MITRRHILSTADRWVLACAATIVFRITRSLAEPPLLPTYLSFEIFQGLSWHEIALFFVD